MLTSVPRTEPRDLKTWEIYHRDREFAREHGDQRLGTVRAFSKIEAELAALEEISTWMPTGPWAVEAPDAR